MTLHCLWIDDNLRAAQKKAGKLLEIFHCKIDFAENFPTAHEKLRESNYAILITDNVFGLGHGGVAQVIGQRPIDNCAGEAFIKALVTHQIDCRSESLTRIVLHTGVAVPPAELLALDGRVKHAYKSGLGIGSLVAALDGALVRL